jgi:hypothetical protein
MMADGISIAKDLAEGSFDRALEAAIEYGMVEGAKAERARIASILGSPEAQGRQQFARHLASQPGISVAVARGALRLTPTEADVLRAGRGSPLALVTSIVGKP